MQVRKLRKLINVSKLNLGGDQVTKGVSSHSRKTKCEFRISV